MLIFNYFMIRRCIFYGADIFYFKIFGVNEKAIGRMRSYAKLPLVIITMIPLLMHR